MPARDFANVALHFRRGVRNEVALPETIAAWLTSGVMASGRGPCRAGAAPRPRDPDPAASP